MVIEMLKIIELFAGVGAQRQALKEAKIEHEVVAISEIDKYAISAYNKLHGDAKNLGDITKIEKLPEADMWTYSFPCTDISLAGHMGGFEKGSNTRSSLLWEVQRLLKADSTECVFAMFGKPSKKVRHIVNLTPENVSDPNISLNQDNLMLLCTERHNKLHGRFKSKRDYKFAKMEIL